MFRLLYTDCFQPRLGLTWPRLRTEVKWTVWFPPERVWERVLTKTNIPSFRAFHRCFLHTVSTKCKGRTCDFNLSSHHTVLPLLGARERGKWRKRERGSRNEAWKSDNLLLCGWFQALVICNLFFFASLHFQTVHFTMAIRSSLNGFSAARHYTPIRQMMSSASRSGVWVRLPTFRVPYE